MTPRAPAAAHPIMFDDDDPVLGRLREVCARFPGSAEVVSHGRPTFKAGERGTVFAGYGGSRKVRPGEHERHDRALLFKPDPGEGGALDQDARFFTPAYLGPAGWLGIDLDEAGTDWGEVHELVDASYRQVAGARLLRELQACDDASDDPSGGPASG